MLIVPTLYALLAYSALPDEVPHEGLDLTKFYADERRSWVIIFGLAMVLDYVRLADHIAHNRDWLIEFAIHVAIWLPIAIVALTVMWIGRSRRWDAAGVVLLSATAVYGMVGWTISVRP